MGDYLMSLIKANDLTNVTGGIPTVKSQQLIPTAWVNFNGIGTVAIRDSENVSSITDNGTGDYSLNFSTAMANADYILAGTSYWKYILGHRNDSHDYFTTTSARVAVGVSTTNIGDSGSVSVLVMGGQA